MTEGYLWVGLYCRMRNNNDHDNNGYRRAYEYLKRVVSRITSYTCRRVNKTKEEKNNEKYETLYAVIDIRPDGTVAENIIRSREVRE